MNGYTPSSLRIVLVLGGLDALSIASGLALTRRRVAGGLLAGWLLLIATVGAAERCTAGEPGGLRMLAICTALFFGFKTVVGVAHLAAGGTILHSGRWLGFTLAWPGMNPAVFAQPRTAAAGGAGLMGRGLLHACLGAGLIFLARLASDQREAATALLLVGLSLVLHFGLFTVLAGLWRMAGIPCPPPFEAPLEATSLAEFWAHRWNRPFSELVQRTIYRPVAVLSGRPTALFAGFLLSGILHELAISIPARAGYGRPLAYFALQGAFVLIEKRLPPIGSALSARVRTLLAVALPLPLLLIPEFLKSAIWPIIGMA